MCAACLCCVVLQVDVLSMAEGLWPAFMGSYPAQELSWLQAAYQEEVRGGGVCGVGVWCVGAIRCAVVLHNCCRHFSCVGRVCSCRVHMVCCLCMLSWPDGCKARTLRSSAGGRLHTRRRSGGSWGGCGMSGARVLFKGQFRGMGEGYCRMCRCVGCALAEV
jgi:hypothetical protein